MVSLQLMLKVEEIKLLQFRNYGQATYRFSERIVGVCGANGTGKTNLLDAIYYLCFTRSYFSRPDAQSVMHGHQGMRMEAALHLEGVPFRLVCILRENNRKEFQVNDGAYKKFSQHIGRFPCVMIAPDDVALITGGSEGRRSFIDAILCQLNASYLQHLIDYNKILQQRNSFLKQAGEQGGSVNQTLLDILDQQLSDNGQVIYNQRKEFMENFLPLVLHHYRKIAGKDDGLMLKYVSQLHDAALKTLLPPSLSRDLALQRTTVGTHKDDLEILMQQQFFRALASQGQRKSLLFALKLAEWEILKENKGFAPILLLDDVFEKLDELRMYNLLHWVCAENEGQVFITDTHEDRLTRQLQDIGIKFQIIALG